MIFAQTLKIAQIMEKAFSAEQQSRVLPKFAKDPRGMLAIGITEPDNASNYSCRIRHRSATTATKAGAAGWSTA